MCVVTGPTHGKAVVCVIGEITIYPEDRSKFRIENTDGTLCTHIVGIDEKWLESESMRFLLKFSIFLGYRIFSSIFKISSFLLIVFLQFLSDFRF